MPVTFLTVSEISDYLRLKTQKLYKLAQKGRIPAYKFGREWRFKQDRIDQWIEEQDNTKKKKRKKSHARSRS